MAAQPNRLLAYPRMWIVLKLKKEAKEKECSVSELISEILFKHFNKK